MADLCAFACKLPWSKHETIVNALSAGQAKYSFLLDMRDPWPDTKYTDIRCRKVGGPHTSERFIDNAKYRGMPDARCGDKVRVGDWEGLIVGHNSSANFDVLATSGRWKGVTLNVHPSEVQIINRPSTGRA